MPFTFSMTMLCAPLRRNTSTVLVTSSARSSRPMWMDEGVNGGHGGHARISRTCSLVAMMFFKTSLTFHTLVAHTFAPGCTRLAIILAVPLVSNTSVTS